MFQAYLTRAKQRIAESYWQRCNSSQVCSPLASRANAVNAASRGAEPMTACVSASTAHFKFAERSVGPLNLVQF
jgi:hypothetical protein